MKVSKSCSCTMNQISFFLVMQLIITAQNALVQGLDIAGYPVPDQCVTICTGASALYNSCTAISCLCTSGSDTEIQQCVNCVIPIEPSLVSVLEPLREDFNALCSSSLPSLTFPPTTITSVTASQVTNSQVTPSTSVEIVPLPTNTGNGAELSVQLQLGSMGFAIGISLLLRLL